MKKVFGIVAVLFVVGWLVALDPLRGAFGFVFGWLLFGYLLFRALPGIRQDLARFRGVRVKRMGRYKGSFL